MFDWIINAEARARIAELTNEVEHLKAALSVKELEVSMLAELNENLRRWPIANSAAAIQVGRSLGVTEKQERPEIH